MHVTGALARPVARRHDGGVTSEPTGVQIVVDEDRCVGIGRCEVLAPFAVELGDDNISRARPGHIPLAVAEDLCRGCPSQAIRIVPDEPTPTSAV